MSSIGKPSCPSRRSKQIHVAFFLLVREAEAVGFRPCRRCKPEETETDIQAKIHHLCRYIETRGDEVVTLTTFSEQVPTSPTHLQRTFKRGRLLRRVQQILSCCSSHVIALCAKARVCVAIDEALNAKAAASTGGGQS